MNLDFYISSTIESKHGNNSVLQSLGQRKMEFSPAANDSPGIHQRQAWLDPHNPPSAFLPHLKLMEE